MLLANQEQFLFDLESRDDHLRVLRFNGQESISKPFRFEIEVATENPELPLKELLGKGALLSFVDSNEEPQRRVRGMVTAAQGLEHRVRFSVYRLVIEPQLVLLDKRINSRIFQFQSVPTIIKTLLEEAGLAADAFRFVLQGDHPERDYCVQYDESELNFFHRLLEEEGMIYYFEHTEDRHVLVIAEGHAAYEDIEPVQVPFTDVSGMVQADSETIHDWVARHHVQTGKVAFRDFEFGKPSLNQHVSVEAQRDQHLEDYLYPGDYREPERGRVLAQWRLDAYRAQERSAQAMSQCKRLVPGYRFELVDHPDDRQNISYLIVELKHFGEQPQVLEEGASDQAARYGNQFHAIPCFPLWYFVPSTGVKNPVWMPPKRPSSPAPKARRFIPTNTAGSRCSFTGTGSVNTTNKVPAGCGWRRCGPAPNGVRF